MDVQGAVAVRGHHVGTVPGPGAPEGRTGRAPAAPLPPLIPEAFGRRTARSRRPAGGCVLSPAQACCQAGARARHTGRPAPCTAAIHGRKNAVADQ
jgi:hypothetical protein